MSTIASDHDHTFKVKHFSDLALIHQDIVNSICASEYNLNLHFTTISSESFFMVALEGSTFTRFFLITTAGVKCCVAAVKRRPKFISVFLYFFLVLRDQ